MMAKQLKSQNIFALAFQLVPATGFEPARLAAYAPKAYVYTNFTTRARDIYYYNIPFGGFSASVDLAQTNDCALTVFV